MLPVPDPDTLRWMASAAAGGLVLAVALALNRAHKWLVFSSEPDPEPEIDIPDTREGQGLRAEDVVGPALALALSGAATVYVMSLPDATGELVFLAAAGVFMLQALANWLMHDDRAPVVGQPPQADNEKHAVYLPLLYAAANLGFAWLA
ncbi:hypothetical protein [Aurantiacibacter gilvus]|uniref:DUF1761 domain-containing protein n=1 Tax=Aurantiacibacter gilvus TaxID=3139141 RepID=A0ABU9IIW6_9SPHN